MLRASRWPGPGVGGAARGGVPAVQGEAVRARTRPTRFCVTIGSSTVCRDRRGSGRWRPGGFPVPGSHLEALRSIRCGSRSPRRHARCWPPWSRATRAGPRCGSCLRAAAARSVSTDRGLGPAGRRRAARGGRADALRRLQEPDRPRWRRIEIGEGRTTSSWSTRRPWSAASAEPCRRARRSSRFAVFARIPRPAASGRRRSGGARTRLRGRLRLRRARVRNPRQPRHGCVPAG